MDKVYRASVVTKLADIGEKNSRNIYKSTCCKYFLMELYYYYYYCYYYYYLIGRMVLS